MAMTMQEMEAYRKMKQEGVEDLSGPIGQGYGDKPQGFSGRSGYEEAVLKREQQSANNSAVAPTGSDVAAKGLASPQAAEAVQAAGSGDAVGTIGSGMMAAGAATANPYLMAGGLAVNVLASGEQNKRANEEKQRQEYNERIARRQEQMSAIGKIHIQ